MPGRTRSITVCRSIEAYCEASFELERNLQSRAITMPALTGFKSLLMATILAPQPIVLCSAHCPIAGAILRSR
jgi:hypothetical protein